MRRLAHPTSGSAPDRTELELDAELEARVAAFTRLSPVEQAAIDAARCVPTLDTWLLYRRARARSSGEITLM